MLEGGALRVLHILQPTPSPSDSHTPSGERFVVRLEAVTIGTGSAYVLKCCRHERAGDPIHNRHPRHSDPNLHMHAPAGGRFVVRLETTCKIGTASVAPLE